MLLLPEDQNAALICVATGTGIAPYRSFWKRCFYEDIPNYKFGGLFWLFMGAANSDAKLYDDEIQARRADWSCPRTNPARQARSAIAGLRNRACALVCANSWRTSVRDRAPC